MSDLPTINPKLKFVLTALAGPTLTFISHISFKGNVDIMFPPIYYVLKLFLHLLYKELQILL